MGYGEMQCNGRQAKAMLAGIRDNSDVYLVDWECVWIPGIDSGLIDIHNSNFDVRAHLCNNTTGWPTNITSTNAANLLNLKHDCSNKRKGKQKTRSYKLKYRPTIHGKQRVSVISDFIMLRPTEAFSFSWNALLLLSPSWEGFGARPSPERQHTQTAKEGFLCSLWVRTPRSPPRAEELLMPRQPRLRAAPAAADSARRARAAPCRGAPRPARGGRSSRHLPGEGCGPSRPRSPQAEPAPRAPSPAARREGSGSPAAPRPRAGKGPLGRQRGIPAGTAARTLTAGRQARSGPGAADGAGALRRGCAAGMLGEDARRAQRDALLRRERQRRRPLFKGLRRARGGRFMARTPSGAVPPPPSPGAENGAGPPAPRSPPAAGLANGRGTARPGPARPRQGGWGAAGPPGTAGSCGAGPLICSRRLPQGAFVRELNCGGWIILCPSAMVTVK